MSEANEILLEFEKKVEILERDYRTAIQRLTDIQKQIPEDKWRNEENEIVKKIESKMFDLGVQFKTRMDNLTDEFISKISEMGV